MMGFQDVLTEQVNDAVKSVWDNLTKEQILEYLAGQEQVTADYLRTMLKNEGIQMQFGVTYNLAAGTSTTEI